MKKDHRELDNFVGFIKRKRGLDLDLYRKSFLLRRLKIRMQHYRSETISEYSKALIDDHQEWNSFLKVLSVNVSEFFRDSEVFNFFYENCLKKLIDIKKAKKHRLIRIWSVGCSYGEEAYSLAILINEILEKTKGFLAKVWATDIDRTALAKAEKGEYSNISLRNLNDILLQKYFIQVSSDRWRVNDELKKIVAFKEHNIFSDIPLKAMDIIFCRNVRIYFDPNQTEKILLTLYNSLRTNGYLVMGMVETLPSNLRDLFVPVQSKYKIYQKTKAKGGRHGKGFSGG